MEVYIEETVVSLGLTNSPYLWSLSDAAVLEDHANVHRRECSEFRPKP